MKKCVAFLILYFIKLSLWFRYKVRYKGVENLTPDKLNRPGGVIFLPNHPTVFVDPSLVVIGIYRKFPIIPLIVEYMYYTPGVHALMKFMDAIPIPNLNSSTNSLKRRKSERAFDEVIKGLKEGRNFLVYPAGRVKLSNYEHIGGASGAHTILQGAPEANVVLVRVSGLYGSRFSTAMTGRSPPIFSNIFQGIKIALKNLLFLTPRREVTIEYVPAPPDFPREAPRLAFNRYLEHWYNRPDGIDPELAKKTLPGESLSLVSYSRWSQQLLPVPKRLERVETDDLSKVPDEVKEKVIAQLAEMAQVDPKTIRPDMNLSADLGLDSLAAAEIFIFLQEVFGVTGVPPSELSTVGRLMAIAAKQVTFTRHEEEVHVNLSHWKIPEPSCPKLGQIPEGETWPEVFLKRCELGGKRAAVADIPSGVLSYQTLKLRVIVLADYLQRLPGKHIGVMLPASVASAAVVLAVQLAGKVPVMINWTVGPRHLESVVELSGIQHVLTSWAFVDRLENIELDSLENKFLFLEDIRRQLGVRKKLKAFFRSRMKAKGVLRSFGADRLKADSLAVILFTSGTEAMPKGVPLTHRNLLADQRGALEKLEIYEHDVLFSILPPFHSFGFTVSGMMGLLAGLRTAYYPNPTDGPSLAKGLPRWGVTIIGGAPTFLRAILKAATSEEMKTIRLCFIGAEKAPPELFALLKKFGLENNLIEGYGITECAPILTVTGRGTERIGVGKAIPGVDLLIVHPETLAPVEKEQQGLILARGPNIFKAYLNPGTHSPFVEVDGKPWYRTGDLGSLDAEGNLTISGRLKRFIKLGGEMVSLVAIETALLEVASQYGWELLEESPSLAVVALESEEEKSRLILFTRFHTTVEEANAALRQTGFSNLVRVSEVHHLVDIPIMGSGKINYRELQARYETDRGSK